MAAVLNTVIRPSSRFARTTRSQMPVPQSWLAAPAHSVSYGSTMSSSAVVDGRHRLIISNRVQHESPHVIPSLTAETVAFRGHNGDSGEAHYALPAGPGKFLGVVVVGHLPGWDEWIIDVRPSRLRLRAATTRVPPALSS